MNKEEVWALQRSWSRTVVVPRTAARGSMDQETCRTASVSHNHKVKKEGKKESALERKKIIYRIKNNLR